MQVLQTLVLKIDETLLEKIRVFLIKECSTALYNNQSATNIIIDINELRCLDSDDDIILKAKELISKLMDTVDDSKYSKDIADYDYIEVFC